MKLISLLAVCALAATVAAEASVCTHAFSCVLDVMAKHDALCVGLATCKDACSDFEESLSRAVRDEAVWAATCGEDGELARSLASFQRSAVVEHLVASAGCGALGCAGNFRLSELNTLCVLERAGSSGVHELAHSFCAADALGVREVLATPTSPFEIPISPNTPPSPPTPSVGNGETGAGIFGFTVLCILLVACIVPMTLLCLKWTVLSIKNFDSEGFLAKFR